MFLILFPTVLYNDKSVYPTHSSDSPDSLVTEPAGVTLMQAFLKGCLQLLGAGNDRSNTLAGLLSLQKGQSVPTSDGSVVEDHTWEKRRKEGSKKVFTCFVLE